MNHQSPLKLFGSYLGYPSSTLDHLTLKNYEGQMKTLPYSSVKDLTPERLHDNKQPGLMIIKIAKLSACYVDKEAKR